MSARFPASRFRAPPRYKMRRQAIGFALSAAKVKRNQGRDKEMLCRQFAARRDRKGDQVLLFRRALRDAL